MDDLDGIEIARNIRALGVNAQIIFISSYDKKWRELFSLNTVAFLDKPADEKVLEQALERAYHLVKKEMGKVFTYKKNRQTYTIPIREIIYFESQRNDIIIWTLREIVQYTGSLNEVWEKFRVDRGFIKPHKSYIVNLQHAIVRENNIIINLVNKHITIGRIFKKETQERYMTYLQGRIK